MISDFAVFITIMIMVLVDYLMGIPSPKLNVPDRFEVGIYSSISVYLYVDVQITWRRLPVSIYPNVMSHIKDLIRKCSMVIDFKIKSNIIIATITLLL